jgi:hypothetical protein
MPKLVFIFITMLLLSCVAIGCLIKRKKHTTPVYERRVAIEGNAENISGHAAVVGDTTGKYYIRGMEQWENEWINQRIKVIGDLEVSENGETRYIKDAVVQMINEPADY